MTIDIQSGLMLCYILNAIFLLLHEIESAYEKEWDCITDKIWNRYMLTVPKNK